MSRLPGTPPPAEVAIDRSLVAALLAEQHPDLATRRLGRRIEGWDNVTFRLGDDLAVRLPRREAAAALIAGEQRWLPRLAPQLPLPVPAPVRTGGPGTGYPWSWSVVPWIEGEPAATAPLLGSESARLGVFLAALHTIELPPDPPQNPYRGVPLADRRAQIREGFGELKSRRPDVDQTPLLAVLAGALDAAPAAAATWLHGDLHSKNVISRTGRISGIVDWGDICGGDPATDLAAAWILFEAEHHAGLRAAYPEATDEVWTRAQGWALSFGLMLWRAHHAGEPAFAEVGLATLRRLAAAGPQQ